MKRFTHFYEPRCRRLLSAARSFAGPVASRPSPGSGQRVGCTCGPGHKTARSEGMTTSHRPRRAARFFFLNHIKVLCLFFTNDRTARAAARSLGRAVPCPRSAALHSSVQPARRLRTGTHLCAARRDRRGPQHGGAAQAQIGAHLRPCCALARGGAGCCGSCGSAL